MVLIEFSIEPMGKGESIAKFVKRAVEIIESSGLKYQVGAMGTVIEGEFPQVMSVLEECIDVLGSESDRLIFDIRGDLRKSSEHTIQRQIESVQGAIQ